MSRLRTLFVTAATVLVVGAPTAASAQTWNHTDPAGDVTHYTWNLDTDEETEVVDPTIAEGDVIGSTVKHNPRKVIATLRFRELTATEDVNSYLFAFRTNKGLNRMFSVYADSEMPRGVHELDKANGNRVRCRGARHSIDYTANTVTVSVPRSCLGRPRWVKAGTASVRFVTSGDEDVFDAMADDGHQQGLADDLVYSPRLRRG